MTERLRRIQIATRILVAITNRTPPEVKDVADLRLWAESKGEGTMPVDDLACVVIQREIERVATRAKA
jgi:hypothetical protein